MEEAKLRRVGSGLVPERDGWFVVDARDAAWVEREGFGVRCPFAAEGPTLRGVESDLEPWSFPQLGVNLAVIRPGERSTLYHAEDGQEDFLVLSGTCTAVIEEQERELRRWDIVHCPPGTRHAFVNTGGEPCVLLMVGARRQEGGIVYPVSELARRNGAGVDVETRSPHEAYAPFPHWRNAGVPNPGEL